MDLNELFSRHRMSVVHAATARSAEARFRHRMLASGYAARITAMQALSGALAPVLSA